MSRPLSALAVLCLVSCSVGLEVPNDTRVTCDSDVSCPSGYECVSSLGYCVIKGTVLDEVAVSFTLPRDADIDVGLNSSVVIVFNIDTTPPSNDTVSLVAKNDAGDVLDDIPVDISSPGATNTLIATPHRRFYPKTRYTLTVHAGVAPADGLLATPSTTEWTATFETAESADVDAPTPAANFVVARISGQAHHLSWDTSDSTDIAGYIVLRNSGAAVTDVPANGKSYARNQTIGVSKVASVGVDLEADDTPTDGAGPWYYAVFPFDTSLNYGTSLQPPLATLQAPIWCPGGTGTVKVASTDSGASQVLIGLDPAAATGKLFPSDTTTQNYGTDIGFALGAPLVEQATVQLRPVAIAVDKTSRYIGLPTALYLSKSVVNLTTTPYQIPIDGTETISFGKEQWPSFIAASDTASANFAAGGTPASVNQAAGTFSATLQTRDQYKMRIKPVGDVSCPADNSWSTTVQFQVGTPANLYVLAGASGTGLSKDDPSGDLIATVNAATNGTTVNVAAGTYALAGSVPLVDGVTYAGSWDSTFTTQSPSSRSSLLQYGSSILSTSGVTLTHATLVEGFHFQMSGNTASGVVSLFGANADLLTINNCWIESTDDTSSYLTMAVYAQAGAPTISNSTIHGSVSVFLEGGSLQLKNNIIEGSSGQRGAVYCFGGAPTIANNKITETVRQDGYFGTAVYLASCNALVTRNKITTIMLPGAAPAFTSSRTAGIMLAYGSATITNNYISGGDGIALSVGIVLDDATTSTSSDVVIIANNTIDVGISPATSSAYGHGRVGIAISNDLPPLGGSHPAAWKVYITNNLIFGDGTTEGFYINSNTYTHGHKVLEHNIVAIADSIDIRFMTIDNTGGDSNVSTAQTTLCGAAVIARNNEILLNTNDLTFFTSPTGPDGHIELVNDNNWDLVSAAPINIRNDGLTLNGTANCGGATCAGTANEVCGNVTTDFDGNSRTASYSVGASEY